MQGCKEIVTGLAQRAGQSQTLPENEAHRDLSSEETVSWHLSTVMVKEAIEAMRKEAKNKP